MGSQRDLKVKGSQNISQDINGPQKMEKILARIWKESATECFAGADVELQITAPAGQPNLLAGATRSAHLQSDDFWMTRRECNCSTFCLFPIFLRAYLIV